MKKITVQLTEQNNKVIQGILIENDDDFKQTVASGKLSPLAKNEIKHFLANGKFVFVNEVGGFMPIDSSMVIINVVDDGKSFTTPKDNDTFIFTIVILGGFKNKDYVEIIEASDYEQAKKLLSDRVEQQNGGVSTLYSTLSAIQIQGSKLTIKVIK